MLLPPPIDLGAFTIETKTVRVQLSTPASVVGWTVQHVVTDGEGGPVKLRKTLAAGVVVYDAANGVWDVTYTPQDLRSTIGAGYWWHCFERLDVGFELVIARGRFQIQTAST